MIFLRDGRLALLSVLFLLQCDKLLLVINHLLLRTGVTPCNQPFITKDGCHVTACNQPVITKDGCNRL